MAQVVAQPRVDVGDEDHKVQPYCWGPQLGKIE